ncbi:hypothetical protein ABFA25_10175 [Mycobacterium lepromatosis]|nr:hypothetical protein [Mycobacterium lepromatosis]
MIADNAADLSATLFYLIAYSFSTAGTVAVVVLILNRDGSTASETTALSHWLVRTR